MYSQTSTQPSWWLLTLVTALIITLLMLTHRLVLSTGWRSFADIGVVFFGYGLVELWLRRNTSALAQHEPDEIKPTIIVVEPFIVAEDDFPQMPAFSDQPVLSNSH